MVEGRVARCAGFPPNLAGFENVWREKNGFGGFLRYVFTYKLAILAGFGSFWRFWAEFGGKLSLRPGNTGGEAKVHSVT